MPTRVLVVANQTAASPALLDAVRRRAAAGDATFTLLVPAAPHGMHRVVDPEVAGRDDASHHLADVLPAIREAAGADVEARVGDADPLMAIQDELNLHGHDEIILSTLPRRLSRWLRMDLPSKAAALGVPVQHVEAEVSDRSGAVA